MGSFSRGSGFSEFLHRLLRGNGGVKGGNGGMGIFSPRLRNGLQAANAGLTFAVAAAIVIYQSADLIFSLRALQ
ncbi:MAG: hypothetical protein OXU61_00900 [Gammaproteobacteria bacterium]|nr:hypothetical protein [Gammaproteobacteria bacterium]